MISITFVAGVIVLLITPGPTNTLLFTAGAMGGRRMAPQLLMAESAAYVAAVTVLGLGLQPVLIAEPRFAMALQGMAALYLLHVAWRLWRSRILRPSGALAPVTPRQIAVTTLLNPKTLIIAFGLMPWGWEADATLALSHLILLAVLTPVIGGLWLLAGHAGIARIGVRTIDRVVPCCAALVLAGFAILLARSAFASL